MKSLEGREPLQAPWQDRGIQKKGGTTHLRWVPGRLRLRASNALRSLLSSEYHHRCMRSDDDRRHQSIFAAMTTNPTGASSDAPVSCISSPKSSESQREGLGIWGNRHQQRLTKSPSPAVPSSPHKDTRSPQSG